MLDQLALRDRSHFIRESVPKHNRLIFLCELDGWQVALSGHHTAVALHTYFLLRNCLKRIALYGKLSRGVPLPPCCELFPILYRLVLQSLVVGKQGLLLRRVNQLVVSKILHLEPVPDFLLLLDHVLSLLGCPMDFLAREHPLLEFIPCLVNVPHFTFVTYIQ